MRLIVLVFGVFIAIVRCGPVVKTPLGPIEGTQSALANRFLGIPFAQPPTGSLRFQPPQHVNSWSPSVLQATKFSAGCPQTCDLPPITCPQSTSEDCLYLNVFTPRNPSAANLPVMVFIPGGHFLQGAAMTELYDGSYIANKTNTIVVVINYRLGALGFLTTEELHGQYGMLDQRMALEWVQENIKSFGGDRLRVTLFGQSAGATSVGVHLVSPATPEGLFQAAIMLSNPVTLTLRNVKESVKIANTFAQDIGCGNSKNTSCLLQAPIDKILKAQVSAETTFNFEKPFELFYPWAPHIDGKVLLEQPIDTMIKGQAKPVPLIAGTVKNDALLFVYSALSSSVSVIEYDAAVTYIFGILDVFKVTKMYPGDAIDKHDTRPELSVLGTDYIFACPARAALAAQSSRSLPVFRYEFAHVASFDPWKEVNETYCSKKVCHGIDLPFAFHSAEFLGIKLTPEEELLSQAHVNYFTNFAHNHNPNNGSSVPMYWPAWGNEEPRNNPNGTLILQWPISVDTSYRDIQCNMWDSLGYNF